MWEGVYKGGEDYIKGTKEITESFNS
jgi:hypothetical protein